MFWEKPYFTNILEFAQGALESNFFTALAGAFAGAYAAQRIADRSLAKSALIDEMRASNQVIALTSSMATTFLSIKKQFAKGYVDKFNFERNRLQEYLFSATSSGAPVHFTPYLVVFPFPKLPDAEVQKVASGKLTLDGPAIQVLDALFQSIESLRHLFELRAKFILQFEEQQSSNIDAKSLAHIYFGFPVANKTDARHHDLVVEIGEKTDDCIQFALLSLERLELHANRLQKNFHTKFRGDFPSVSRLDLSKVDKALLPDRAEYKDWL